MNLELEQILRSATNLPVIPAVATKVLELVDSLQVNNEELAKLIGVDPALSMRVLKLANSSFYGCPRKILTLPHAVMMLGYGTLRTVVISMSLRQIYSPFGLAEKNLWEHSVGVGLAAGTIAKFLHLNADEAFLCGIFHDLGKIVMNYLDPVRFSQVMQAYYNFELSYIEAEQQNYSYTHAELGSEVIKKWNLPLSLSEVVAKHHTLHFDPDADDQLVELTCITNLGDLFCECLGIGTRGCEVEVNLAESTSAKMLNLDAEQLELMLLEFKTQHEANADLFNKV